MTREEFQKAYSNQLKELIESKFGQELLNALSSLRPPYQFSPQSHLFLESCGATRGYELCIRNLISLSIPHRIQTEIEPTYGVPNK